MPLVIPPGFAQCASKLTLTGDPETIIVTFGLDVSGAAGDFAGVGRRVNAAWTGTGSPMASIASQYRYAGCVLYVGQDGAPPVVVEVPDAFDGTNGSAPLPQNCAVLVRKQSALGGREGRGRMFVPGVPEVGVDATGALTAAVITEWQSAWDGFMAELALPDVAGPPTQKATSMVILHTEPQLGGAPAPTPVTSLAVQTRIATQRRRLRR